MKRNKPIVRQRKAGTQSQRRRPYWFDDRGSNHWALAVPQAFAGVDQTVFNMTGAVAAGADENRPEDPRFGSVLRWRIDRVGQTEFVYGEWIWSGRPLREHPTSYGKRLANSMGRSIPTSLDVYHVFVAERGGCTHGTKCSLTRYFYSDADIELPRHRPDRCPMSVLNDGPPWRLVGRTVPDGRHIY
ncbi:hypothetical protein OG369_39840 [Streptomyces sp. NBC_01221]|uniref:hypothetical protein n=1 Tax=Streptomyces sp. NBC_01221 TaxID=2903782 RepID=UPI00224EF906|nr:hypothetical protein [Streptomyces sp. NBC_01221]MCX4792002.1 hypothetical protein [Streptomyces sp. NBC_01221]